MERHHPVPVRQIDPHPHTAHVQQRCYHVLRPRAARDAKGRTPHSVESRGISVGVEEHCGRGNVARSAALVEGGLRGFGGRERDKDGVTLVQYIASATDHVYKFQQLTWPWLSRAFR